ncbi:hypothetical protein FLP41_07130 [Paracoccus marcusii]|uniref:hypothetical protein n=1 Tax=Paracoccus marcusii TaxID=59779 RepID=UPI002ED1BBB2|nr:hypothetical protein FLP41_07130 [Paracoccus marcusii]
MNAADAAQRAAEARLDLARREICRSGLKLRCERGEPTADGASVWRVWLVPPEPLPLAGIGTLRVWPITRGDGHANSVLGLLRQGQPADLGAMPLVDLTRFLACHLTDEHEDVSILFSTGLMMDGLTAERHAAILRWVIDSRDAFFRYLRLLLSELGDPSPPLWRRRTGPVKAPGARQATTRRFSKRWSGRSVKAATSSAL